MLLSSFLTETELKKMTKSKKLKYYGKNFQLHYRKFKFVKYKENYI